MTTTTTPRPADQSSPTILLVEPDAGRRSDVRETIERARLRLVGEARYGVEAVSAAREAGADAVLLSLIEPKARALATVEALSASLPGVPIIVYAPGHDPATMRGAMGAGALDYLPMPLRPEELARSVMQAMKQIERRRVAVAGGSDRAGAAGSRGSVITVFGAKGGIGKTTLACNLAVELREQTGQSVALVDLDTRFGDVAIMMDSQAETSIADVVRDIDQIDRESVQRYMVEHPTGVQMLPAPRHPSDWGEIRAEDVERVVERLAAYFDYVVLDTPGTFNDIVALVLEIADTVLLMTSLDLASVKDTILTYDLLESWDFPAEKIKTVVNRITPVSSLRDADVELALERALFWRLPYDPTVIRATELRQPVVVAKPRAPFSGSVRELAALLGGTSAARRRSGLLARLIRR